ncbi:type III pantothenate kinase [Arenimonas sp.]|uniref:type III pantothenate kinase n=1 Tax=Arenimonas sp. TaxID=1872635 RepID=UPI0039E5FE97
MNWLIDLGNTRLKLAALQPDGRAGEVRACTHAEAVVEGLEGIAAGDVAHLASVADARITGDVERALDGRGVRVRRVRSEAQCGRLRIAYAAPERLGVDRFLALLAASERSDGPHLIVSVGSALTVDLLAKDGQHIGGLIAATPAHQRRALAERFPVLDVADGEIVDFACDTDDAVVSGVQAAALGLIERGLRQATMRLGEPARLLVTGGGAADLGDLSPLRPIMLPNLVIDGLALHAGWSAD